MSMRYPGRRVDRGSVLGGLLVWLVGAATLVGFLFVLFRDHPVPDPGTQAEIAARTAPVGRLTLVAPRPDLAVQPPTTPTTAGLMGRETSAAATSPPGSASVAAASAPVVDAEVREEVVVEIPALGDAGGLETGSTPDQDPGVAVNPGTASVGDATVSEVDAKPSEGFAPAMDTSPSSGERAPAATAAGPRDAEEAGIGGSGAPLSGATASVSTQSATSSALGSETRWAAPAPPPGVRLPVPFQVPYRMVPVYRPDLPGAPYQLVPLTPRGP